MTYREKGYYADDTYISRKNAKDIEIGKYNLALDMDKIRQASAEYLKTISLYEWQKKYLDICEKSKADTVADLSDKKKPTVSITFKASQEM